MMRIDDGYYEGDEDDVTRCSKGGAPVSTEGPTKTQMQKRDFYEYDGERKDELIMKNECAEDVGEVWGNSRRTAFSVDSTIPRSTNPGAFRRPARVRKEWRVRRSRQEIMADQSNRTLSKRKQTMSTEASRFGQESPRLAPSELSSAHLHGSSSSEDLAQYVCAPAAAECRTPLHLSHKESNSADALGHAENSLEAGQSPANDSPALHPDRFCQEENAIPHAQFEQGTNKFNTATNECHTESRRNILQLASNSRS